MYFLRFWLMVGLVSKVIIWFIDRICCSYNAVELPMGKGLWVCRTFACAGVYKLQCWCILLVLGCVWAGCSVDAADCKYRLERCILDAFCLKISQANCLLREAFTGRLKPYLCCSCSFLPPCCSFLQMPFAQTSGLLDPPGTAISHGFPGHIFLQITSGQAHFFVFVSCAVVLRGRQWGMLKWAQLALAGLHRMMEWFKLEGALKVFWFQPCCIGRVSFYYSRLLLTDPTFSTVQVLPQKAECRARSFSSPSVPRQPPLMWDWSFWSCGLHTEVWSILCSFFSRGVSGSSQVPNTWLEVPSKRFGKGG